MLVKEDYTNLRYMREYASIASPLEKLEAAEDCSRTLATARSTSQRDWADVTFQASQSFQTYRDAIEQAPNLGPRAREIMVQKGQGLLEKVRVQYAEHLPKQEMLGSMAVADTKLTNYWERISGRYASRPLQVNDKESRSLLENLLGNLIFSLNGSLNGSDRTGWDALVYASDNAKPAIDSLIKEVKSLYQTGKINHGEAEYALREGLNLLQIGIGDRKEYATQEWNAQTMEDRRDALSPLLTLRGAFSELSQIKSKKEYELQQSARAEMAKASPKPGFFKRMYQSAASAVEAGITGIKSGIGFQYRFPA